MNNKEADHTLHEECALDSGRKEIHAFLSGRCVEGDDMKNIPDTLGIGFIRMDALLDPFTYKPSEGNDPYSSDLVLTPESAIPNRDALTEDDILDKIDAAKVAPRALNLSFLSFRERKVVRMRFGFEGDPDGMSLEEVAGHFSLTKERIRQIEAKALRKMRLWSKRVLSGMKMPDAENFVDVSDESKTPEYLPPTLEDLEKVYLFIPDTRDDMLVRSLEPTSFAAPYFTLQQIQWLYALQLCAVNQKELRKYLADNIFRCSTYQVVVQMARLIGKPFLQSYHRQGDAWRTVVDIGLEEKAMTYLTGLEKKYQEELKEKNRRRAKLDIAYSYIPDDRDAVFVRNSEQSDFPKLPDSVSVRWIYELFLFGPKDEAGRQELMQYVADEIFHCPVSEVAEVIELSTKEGREKHFEKYSWFIDYGMRRIEEYIQKKD